MPLGPNSLANDCANALMANLPVANDAQLADPFMAAVAEVKIKVGGYSGEFLTLSSSSGKTACEKWKAPRLFRLIVSTRMYRADILLKIQAHSTYPLASHPASKSSSDKSRKGFRTNLPPTL